MKSLELSYDQTNLEHVKNRYQNSGEFQREFEVDITGLILPAYK